MKKIQKKLGSILLFVMFFSILLTTENVKAEEATITFGSESYTSEKNGEFLVGVYIQGESVVGTYRVELEYDDQRLEYTGGAESEEDGVVILEGTGLREQVKYMLSFKCNSGGEAYIKVRNAVVNISSSDNTESFELTELDTAFITISGEDTVGLQQEETTKPKPAFETDIPHIEPAIVMNGKEYFVTDISAYVPEEIDWEYQTANLSFMGQDVTFLTNDNHNVYFTYLIDETETLHFYAYNQSSNLFYPCEIYTTDEQRFYCASPYVCRDWPEELTLDIVNKQHIIYAMDRNGHGDFYHTNQDGELVKWDEEEAAKFTASQTHMLVVILVIAVVVIIIIWIVVFFTGRELERKKRSKNKRNMCLPVEELEPEEIQQMADEMQQIPDEMQQIPDEMQQIPDEIQQTTTERTIKKEKPVISVQDVTMRFKVSTSNASSIKEYIINLFQRKISYRELLALNHVSFDIYKGEVVGIIGTNGSGKSTVLRIVSGALEPTEGRVKVDKKKVQLLTLGTGFDRELTARENVYLNGAIIGYSEEFINEHYDEIVEFAELQGFMEEKVKNFSSGMVSRLGFAIATIGEAAEILILDEVLSVGDEFFKKKSLQKVKEMIHGGSTVLMVSHGMQTIIENCTKVVWIEKGVVKMIGKPKLVCAAYRKQHG